MFYPKIKNLFKRREDGSIIFEELSDESFSNIKYWELTEKLDGTNIKIDYYDDEYKIYIHGRTEQSEKLPWIEDYIDRLRLEEKLYRISEKHGCEKITIFGEGIGPKIQSGSDYCLDHEVRVFDILINDKWWMTRSEIQETCNNIGMLTVPTIIFCYEGYGWILDDIINFVKDGFTSCVFHNQNKIKDAEGIVARPRENLFNNKGERIMFKLRTEYFK